MANIGAYITPENVTTLFRISSIVAEYARNLARQRGMSEEEIEALYQESLVKNVNDLGDYVHELGGVWPPVAPVIPPTDTTPPLPVVIQYGAAIDVCPPDSELADGTIVYRRPDDGKWFLWHIGVFTDPRDDGFVVHHRVRPPVE